MQQLVDHGRLGTIIRDVLMHNREVLQRGPTGAPLPDGLFRPRGCRSVGAHVNDPVYPVVPVAAPRPGQLLNPSPHVR